VRSAAVCLFGKELGTNDVLIPIYKEFANEVGHFMNRKSPVLALFPTFARWWMWFKFKMYSPTAKYRAKILKHAMPIMNERRRQMRELGDEYDRPIDALQAYLNTAPLDKPIDELEFGSIILALVLFSIHSTTKRTTSCVYNLALHPQFIPELLEEQRLVLGENWVDGAVEVAHLKQLTKMDSFIRETMRTSNRSIALPHKIVGMDEWKLPNGYVLPKGTVVNINAEDVYYSPELQGPNPREFNAWRFLGSEKVATRIGPDMIAFGLGRHACPGRFFAVHEMKLALSLFLKRYSITIPKGAQRVPEGPLLFTPVKIKTGTVASDSDV